MKYETQTLFTAKNIFNLIKTVQNNDKYESLC